MHPFSRVLGITVLGALVAGCGSPVRPSPDCCYQGPAAVTRLAALQVVLEDGRALPFEQVFSGFAASGGWFNRRLPFEEALSQDIIYQSLVPLLPLYDANRNGRLEAPEVVVLYAREAALGAGIPVAHFGPPPGVWAVSTANADVGALVAWAEARRASMTPRAQRVFRDLERVGHDIRTRSDAGPRRINGIFQD